MSVCISGYHFKRNIHFFAFFSKIVMQLSEDDNADYLKYLCWGYFKALIDEDDNGADERRRAEEKQQHSEEKRRKAEEDDGLGEEEEGFGGRRRRIRGK